MSLADHIRLLTSQISKYPWITLIVCASVVGVNIVYYTERYPFAVFDYIALTVGVISAILFLKLAIMFSLYNFLNEQKFDGSFFIMGFLAATFFIISLSMISFVSSRYFDEFPSKELPFLILVSFLIVATFLSLVFLFSNRAFGSRTNE